MEEKVKWKKARARIKRTFNEAKRRNWRGFTSSMNRNTSSCKVWEIINSIRGRPPSKIQILYIDNRCISTVSGIANAFAIVFENVSSKLNYFRSFLEHKNKVDR